MGNFFEQMWNDIPKRTIKSNNECDNDYNDEKGNTLWRQINEKGNSLQRQIDTFTGYTVTLAQLWK